MNTTAVLKNTTVRSPRLAGITKRKELWGLLSDVKKDPSMDFSSSRSTFRIEQDETKP